MKKQLMKLRNYKINYKMKKIIDHIKYLRLNNKLKLLRMIIDF